MPTPDECYACVRMKISCPVHDVKPTADIPAASSDLLKKKEFVFKMTYSFFQHCFNTSCDLPVETPIASEIAVNFEELMVRLNDVSGIVEWIDYYMEDDKKTHLIANGKLTEEAESDDDESDKSEDSEDESTENKTDPWLLRCSCGVQYTARCLNELDYPTVCTKCMEAAISSDLLCRECGVEYKAGDYYEFKYPTSCSSCKAAEERPCMECGDDACDGHPQICEWCGKTADDDTAWSVHHWLKFGKYACDGPLCEECENKMTKEQIHYCAQDCDDCNCSCARAIDEATCVICGVEDESNIVGCCKNE